jgi:penicillin-binding protein 2
MYESETNYSNSVNTIINNRLIIVHCIFTAMILFLIVMLYLISVKDNERYTLLSTQNRIKRLVIPAERGLILDRNGIPLTENQINYTLSIYNNISDSGNNNEVVNKIFDTITYNKNTAPILNKIKNEKGKALTTVLNHISWEDLVKIENNFHNIKKIDISVSHSRYYNYPTTFAHIIGYISNPTEDEINKNKDRRELMLHPEFKIGRNGIEKNFNSYLTGKVGYRIIEVNAINEIMRDVDMVNQQNGKDLRLTIDLKLQQFVEKKFKDKSGTAIVMNVKTGEILSMFSSPTFDTNKFIDGVELDYWKELNDNTSKPLNNKAISGVYPPGSTFKLITAIAALENGWNPDKVTICRGEIRLNKKRVLHCWKETGHGPLNLVDAIQHSCNIYFSEIGLYTGIDKIYETAIKFGLGEKYDLQLSNVRSGTIPNKEWKKKVLNDVWVAGDTVNIAIGQGFLSVTPLELVVMTARIANGGYPIKPFIVLNNHIANYNKNILNGETIAKPKNIELIKNGMYNVVNKKGGTSYYYRITEEGMEMAGKTGTAQVISKDNMEILKKTKENISSNFKNHGLFIAFAPFNNPKYAIVVVIEHGNSGSSSGGPVARDILKYAQNESI